MIRVSQGLDVVAEVQVREPHCSKTKAARQSDRCQEGNTKTVSCVLYFPLGPKGCGTLLALAVKQPM